MKRQSVNYNKYLIIIEHKSVNKYKLLISNPVGKIIRWVNCSNKEIGINLCKNYINQLI